MREGHVVGVDLGATRARVFVENRRGELLWRTSKVMLLPGEVEDYVGDLVEARAGVTADSSLAWAPYVTALNPVTREYVGSSVVSRREVPHLRE